MKLLTKQLEKRFAQVGSQENHADPLILAKFFNPTGAGTWYASEYDPKTASFSATFPSSGIGTTSGVISHSNELEAYRGKFGLGIERDRFFREDRASRIINCMKERG